MDGGERPVPEGSQLRVSDVKVVESATWGVGACYNARSLELPLLALFGPPLVSHMLGA